LSVLKVTQNELVFPLPKRMNGRFWVYYRTVLAKQATSTYFDALYFIAVVTPQAAVMTTGAPQPISV
jgi:hypothetical protein